MINKRLFSHFVTIEKAITTKRNDAKRFQNFNRLFWKRFLCWMSNNSSGNNSMRLQRYSIPHIVDVNKVCNCLKKSFTSFLKQYFRFGRNIILLGSQSYHYKYCFKTCEVMYILENILWNLYLKVYLTYSLSIRVLYLQLIVCCCRAKSNWTKQRKHFQNEKKQQERFTFMKYTFDQI